MTLHPFVNTNPYLSKPHNCLYNETTAPVSLTSRRESPAVLLNGTGLDEEKLGFLDVPLDLRDGFDQLQTAVDASVLHVQVGLVSVSHEPHHQAEGRERSWNSMSLEVFVRGR